jgi:phytoene dehydrogenase-like protein
MAPRVFANDTATEAAMASFSDTDLSGCREAVALYRKTAKKLLALQQTALPSSEMVRQFGRIAASPVDAERLCRILLSYSRQFVDRYFRSDEVKGLIAPWAFHSDYGPDVPGGAAFAFVTALSSFENGISISEGGAGRISEALRTLIIENGGKIQTDSEVTRIHIRRGAAVAVTTANGDVISASQAIIAGVTPRNLFGRLVRDGEAPTGFFRRIRRFRYGIGTFVLHLALSHRLEWRAAENLSEFNTVHIGGGVEQLARTYQQSLAGQIPERPLLIVSQPTSIDPTRAPNQQHIARIHSRAFTDQILGDAAGRIHSTNWDDAKEAVSDRLMTQLQEHAPNLRDVLLAHHAVSPLDLERENPNFIGGDCASGSQHLDQNYFWRPVFGWSRYRTPINHLYMIGSSTWPGSGIHGSSGYLLANQLLQIE